MTSPPRGYSWPQFEPGNVAAVGHGAICCRKVAEVAETLRPTLAGPLDAPVDPGPPRRRSRCLRLGVALVIAVLVVLVAGIGLLVIRRRGAHPTNR